jgi:hypothetical protein
MLERYSHIRMNAKREAVKALSTASAATSEDGVGAKMGAIAHAAIVHLLSND